MGQSSSREQEVSPDLREAKSLAASTGALPHLEKAFSVLSDPQTKSIPTHSLKDCFDLTFENLECEQGVVLEEFSLFLSHLSSTIVKFFFVDNKDGVNWVEFLKGYVKCCARTSVSALFNNILLVFSLTCSEAGLPVNLKFEQYDDDCKISGSLSPHDIFMLLSTCWIFSWDSRLLTLSKQKSTGKCSIPDVSNLLLSAIESSVEDGHQVDFWDSVVPESDIQLPAGKVHLWALKTLPNLPDCLQQFVHARLCHFATHENKSELSYSYSREISSPAIPRNTLLTCGRAWAISLTLRGSMHEEISRACFPSDIDGKREDLLYSSSIHGKGINRFWSNVEGYNGPLLLLAACEDKSTTKRWIIGALTYQGFENKDAFYGTSGNLYSISPVFHALSSSGREKNFVYSHLHPTFRMYEPHPKPVGIAFGGSLGNERIFMDEDFSTLTLRHHAVDKTYQHGPLFPNQGYLQTEASILEVEVWGLGGKRAREIQASFKKREELFTEQRRKVDLKTFANWEDSPEKMMMDMMSNPNAARREER